MISLSVVIPTYNRAERLKACLDALTCQTQPASDFEVIVVVDGSIDHTMEMLKNLTTPFPLKVLFQENKGQHLARNFGVDYAHGRYCLFLDDDIIAEPELIAEHLSLHRQYENVVGIGQMLLRIPENPDWFTVSFAKGWHQHYEELNRDDRKPSWLDCYGGNLSLARSLFLEMGGFASDIRRSHDIELGYRLQQRGLRFVYLPRAIGWQDDGKGVRELSADAEKSGSAWVKLCERHPAMHPQLLGPVLDASLPESVLRELFWWVRISPWILAVAGRLMSYLSLDRKWYRFLASYFYWRGCRKALSNQYVWQLWRRGTPILMYHAFSASRECASRFVLPIETFARQMHWLKRLGYRVISLDEFLSYHRRHVAPPLRSIVITIDDGYAEICTLVQPILQNFRFPATVFLVSEKVGSHNDWARSDDLIGRQLLSWDQIHDLLRNGIWFGAHARTHRALTKMTLQQARLEIEGSKSDLEQELGHSELSFAYPFGDYDLDLQGLVAAAGFRGGCTADHGSNILTTPFMALRRIEIIGTWSLAQFLITILLGYSRRRPD